ncbi:hypothetical protein BVRB_2g038330 [Beta vulgaris subsp. vulgaris]|nr:hypothetical protein BVRB_2g038330 [Beta vulgaris subsp. vulgaris]
MFWDYPSSTREQVGDHSPNIYAAGSTLLNESLGQDKCLNDIHQYKHVLNNCKQNRWKHSLHSGTLCLLFDLTSTISTRKHAVGLL